MFFLVIGLLVICFLVVAEINYVQREKITVGLALTLINECGGGGYSLLKASKETRPTIACDMAKKAGVYNAYAINTAVADYDDLLERLIIEVRAVKAASARAINQNRVAKQGAEEWKR